MLQIQVDTAATHLHLSSEYLILMEYSFKLPCHVTDVASSQIQRHSVGMRTTYEGTDGGVVTLCALITE